MSDSDPLDEDYEADLEDEQAADHVIHGDGDEDDGYTTAGFTSGEEGDGPDGDYFSPGLNPHTLLAQLGGAQPGSATATQPYQILAASRAAAAAAAAADGSSGGGGGAAVSEASSGGGGDEEEDEQAAADGADDVELRLGSEPKRKQRKKGRGGGGRRGPRQMELPEHVSRMVGHANLLYASNKYEQAIDLLLEVIRQVPNLADPYATLGALHEVTGDARKALDFYMIAAHMTGKDVNLWHKLAIMSDEQGFTRQAIYCWTKVLSRQRDDFDARFCRARLYPAVNEPWKAKQQFSSLLEEAPGHPEVVKALVTLYHDLGQLDKAVEVLEGQLREHYALADLTHINMLTDLYMATGHYDNAVQLINRSEAVMCAGEPLPIDLKVRRGTCLAHMGDSAAASADLQQLLALPVVEEGEGGESYEDLYLLVTQEVSRLGLAQLALPFMDKLRDAPGVLVSPDQWQMLAECYVAAGLRASAVQLYRDRLTQLGKNDERYCEVGLCLAQLLVDGGEAAAAATLLSELEQGQQQGSITLPPGQRQQMSIYLVQAGLQLRLGNKAAFAAALLPQLTSLLDQAENNAAIVAAAIKASASGVVPTELVRALKRRKMYARKGGRKGEGGAETDTVFQGYVSRDRRRPHIAFADQAAEQLLKRARAAGRAAGAASEVDEADDSDDPQQPEESPGPDGGAAAVAAAAAAGEGAAAAVAAAAAAASGDGDGGLPAELEALVVAANADLEDSPDLFGDPQLYGAFVDLVHVLLETGQQQQAAELLARATTLGTTSTIAARDNPWWGPSAAAAAKRKASRAASSAATDGFTSDGGATAGTAGGSSSARREQSRMLREGLRLLSAEVNCRQGNIEEALKLLKSVLPKWPYSWQAWSLYCCCCGQLGRVNHWMKTVAALRAKHPDSLPLQVLASHADNMSGEHAVASNGYAAALMSLPNEPLLLLCLGAAQIDLALGRSCKDRNGALLRGFASLHSYARHRGPAAEAEAAYNLGRAAHEVGLLHLAVAHYERVLQLADEAALAEAQQQLQSVSLQQQQDGGQQGQAAGLQLQGLGRQLAREAAHNLSLIYRGSGADDLARLVVRTYLTV